MKIGLEPLLNDERVGGPGATWMGLRKYLERLGHEVVAGVDADAYILLMGYDLGSRFGQGKTVILQTSGCGISSTLRQRAQDRLFRTALKWASIVFSLGPWPRQQIREMLGIDIGSRMIFGAVDHEVFHPRRTMRRPKRPSLITACANWDDWLGRRLSSHIDTAKRLGWPLHIFGAIEHPPSDELIFTHGLVDHKEMALFYRHHPGIFLMAQWLQAWPHIVAEAMMSGLPIVYADVGGTAYMVGPGGIGVREPRTWDFKPIDYQDPASYWEPNTEELAEACVQVWDGWKTYARLGHQRARARFTYRQAVNRYMEYLEGI